MKPILLYIGLFFSSHCVSQNRVTYMGTIGDTARIEMEISTNNEKDYAGRYRHEHSRDWILLKGAMYYDRRNKIPQNLVLHEFGNSSDTAVFDLYMEGNALTGTWQRNPHMPIYPVQLEIGKLKGSTEFDGIYYDRNNRLSVKSVSENSIEVDIEIQARADCPAIKLKGALLKVGNEWKGSMPDQEGNGEAAVIISFSNEAAYMEIVPAFIPGAACQISSTKYVRQMPKTTD